ncbi:inositol monophosphatase [Candidatus Woesearchaeota archaeon]|nr:inositol monophosphatase [Candidatus Woesearchaeota archaeon]
MNLSHQKRVALLAARQAGKVLLKYYGKKEFVRQKSNKSLVATADLEANKVIIKIIKKHYPNHSILSEETGFENNKSDYKWVIDPLDGTHNFLHQIPFFGTSIALEHKNEIMLGVIIFPVLDITAIAEKGKGAFLNEKRIKVSSKKYLDHSFIMIEFSYSKRKEKIDFLEKLVHKTIDVRNFGCAIYGLLLIACGRCDGFVILTTNEWDIAAGFLIVEEAGGRVTGLDGTKWNPKQKQYLVTNGKIHNQLLKYVK